MKLCQLVKNNYNSSTAVLAGDAMGNFIETLHSYLSIKGAKNVSFPKHVEASEHNHQALEDSGFSSMIEGLVMK